MNRYTVKRISPYVDYRSRCQYAVETFRSITAPRWEQVLELSLMYWDE